MMTLLYSAGAMASSKFGTITLKVGQTRVVEVASGTAYTATGSWSKDGTCFSITGQGNLSCTIKGLRAGNSKLYYKGYVAASGWSTSQYWDFYWDVEVVDSDPDPIPVTKITVSPSTATLKLDGTKTVQLSAEVLPSNATNKSVTWSTSSSSIATVSSSGLVTAQAAGSATITCKATDGSGVYGTCAVTVSAPTPDPIKVTGISLNYTSVSLVKGDTRQLRATVTPSNATDKTVKWSSSNSSVAWVSSDGLVTAVERGTATITCKANDGSGVTGICDVTVASVKDYSYFTAKTVEGIEVKYYVSKVADGVCEVSSSAIDKSTTGKITIPAEVEGLKVTSIRNNAFMDCTGLTSVSIPSTVTTIGYRAFRGCTGLTSVSLGNGVKELGDYVFQGCTSLATITGISQLESIGRDAFEGESYDTYIPWYNSLPDGLLYLGKVLYNYKGTMPDNTTVNVTEGTTQIGYECFHYCTGLIGITVPKSVRSIGGYAFDGCENLSSITVASGNEVYDSRNSCNAIIETAKNTMIAGCKSTTFPSTVTDISRYAFCGSVAEEVVIPNNIESIAYGAFYFLDGLRSVIIGKGTRIVDDSYGPAFISCNNLRSIAVVSDNPYIDSRDNCNAIIDKATDRLIVGCPATSIPLSVKSIGKMAFYDFVNAISSVVIPDNVETIMESAFKYNYGLTTLVLGKNLQSIGKEAFLYCYKLQTIQSLANSPAEMDESAFRYYSSDPDYIYNNATLYVPVGSKINYMTSTGWSRFKNIVEGEPSGIEQVVMDGLEKDAPVYNLRGQRLAAPQKGVNIIGGKKVVVK